MGWVEGSINRNEYYLLPIWLHETREEAMATTSGDYDDNQNMSSALVDQSLKVENPSRFNKIALKGFSLDLISLIYMFFRNFVFSVKHISEIANLMRNL